MEINNSVFIKYSSVFLFTKYVMPNIIGSVLSSMLSFSVMAFISKYISAEAFTAVNIVNPMTTMIYGIYVMFATGAIAFCGKALGNDNREKSNIMFTQILISAFIFSIFFMIFIYIFRNNILTLLGAYGKIHELSIEFFILSAISSIIYGFAYILAQFIRLNGSANWASFIYVSSPFFLFIFSLIFFQVLKINKIFFAGLSMLISQLITLLVAVIYFIRPKCQIKILRFKKWIYNFKIIGNGASDFLMNSSIFIIPWLFNRISYNIVSEGGIMAYSVSSFCIVFITYISYSISEVLGVLISYSYGLRNKIKMKDFLRISIIYCFVISFVLSAILFINPYSAVNSFLKDVDDNIINMAVNFVRAISCVLVILSINIIMSVYYTAIQDIKASEVISLLRSLILPLILLLTLPNFLGFSGLILVIPISEILTLITAMILYKKRRPDVLINH